MHAKDRITTDSAQHWVLYTLNLYEQNNTSVGVTPETLYVSSGELLPSPKFIEDAAEELHTRRLVEKVEHDGETHYHTCNPAGAALNHHGKPDRTPWTSPTLFAGEASVDTDDEWVPAPSENFYYESESDEYSRGEEKVANAVAERFPQWTVVVTMGPLRGHDVMFMVSDDDQPIIQLDFYSPNPGLQYRDALLWELGKTLKQREIKKRFSGESGDSDMTTWKQPHELA